MKTNKCKFKSICPTPNLHSGTKASYIDEVCNTSLCSSCTHFISLEAQKLTPESEDWKRAEEYFKKRRGEK